MLSGNVNFHRYLCMTSVYSHRVVFFYTSSRVCIDSRTKRDQEIVSSAAVTQLIYKSEGSARVVCTSKKTHHRIIFYATKISTPSIKGVSSFDAVAQLLYKSDGSERVVCANRTDHRRSLHARHFERQRNHFDHQSQPHTIDVFQILRVSNFGEQSPNLSHPKNRYIIRYICRIFAMCQFMTCWRLKLTSHRVC